MELTVVLMAVLFGSTFVNGGDDNVNKLILEEFYNATGGPTWTQSQGWNEGTPCGNSWFGIKCRSNNDIVQISLPDNMLAGEIPESFGQLNELLAISLELNVITSIPSSIGNFTELLVFSLDFNSLVNIPDVYENLTSLVEFRCTACVVNARSSPLPLSLFSLPSLEIVSLDQNQFGGTLPPLVGMTQLRTLQLASNELLGRLDLSLLKAEYFEFLDVSRNLFTTLVAPTGVFPKAFLDLKASSNVLFDDGESGQVISTIFEAFPNITNLALEFNNLSGDIPTLPSSLVSLIIQSNQFLSLPFDLCKTAPGIVDLSAANNNLSGSIPTLQCSKLQRLDLPHNSLTGAVGNIYLPRVKYMSLAHNSLSGSILGFEEFLPPDLVYLDLGHNDFDGTVPENLISPRLEVLDLSDNSFSGSLPPIGTLVRTLNAYDNSFSGTIPDSYFTVVSEMITLDISNNLISGTIADVAPAELNFFSASNNQLSGTVPGWICDVTARVNLSGNTFLCPTPTCCTTLSCAMEQYCCGTCQDAPSPSGFPAWATALLVVAVCLLGALFVFLFALHRRRRHRQSEKGERQSLLGAGNIQAGSRSGSGDVADPERSCPGVLRSVEKSTSLLSDIVLLDDGGGSAGPAVRRGLWQNTTRVYLAALDPDVEEAFLASAEMLRRFQHPNLVIFLGLFEVMEGTSRRLYKVTEYLVQGTLRSVLRDASSKLTCSELTNIARDVSAGLAFLNSARIVHRHIATDSILVKQEGGRAFAKIGHFDFRTARFLERPLRSVCVEEDIVASDRLRWSAPEVVQTQTYSAASDVYSLGVTVWEIFNRGEEPWGGVAVSEVVKAVLAGQCVQRTPSTPQFIYEHVIEPCCAREHFSRPSGIEVYNILKSMVPPETKSPVSLRFEDMSGNTHTPDYVNVISAASPSSPWWTPQHDDYTQV